MSSAEPGIQAGVVLGQSALFSGCLLVLFAGDRQMPTFRCPAMHVCLILSETRNPVRNTGTHGSTSQHFWFCTVLRILCWASLCLCGDDIHGLANKASNHGPCSS